MTHPLFSISSLDSPFFQPNSCRLKVCLPVKYDIRITNNIRSQVMTSAKLGIRVGLEALSLKEERVMPRQPLHP